MLETSPKKRLKKQKRKTVQKLDTNSSSDEFDEHTGEKNKYVDKIIETLVVSEIEEESQLIIDTASDTEKEGEKEKEKHGSEGKGKSKVPVMLPLKIQAMGTILRVAPPTGSSGPAPHATVASSDDEQSIPSPKQHSHHSSPPLEISSPESDVVEKSKSFRTSTPNPKNAKKIAKSRKAVAQKESLEREEGEEVREEPPEAVTPAVSTSGTGNAARREQSDVAAAGLVGEKKKSTKGKEARKKNLANAQFLCDMTDKYKYLSKYAVLEKVNPIGEKLVFECVKCKPKQKLLKASNVSIYNVARHYKLKHQPHIKGFTEAYLVKGRGEETTTKKRKENESADEECEDEAEEEDSHASESGKVQEKSVAKSNLSKQPSNVSTGSSSTVTVSHKAGIGKGKGKLVQPDISQLPKVKEQIIRNATVNFFVSNFIAMNVVESESYKKLINAHNPYYKHISRRTLMRQTGDRYTTIFQKLVR